MLRVLYTLLYSRIHNTEANLRDGLYCQLLSVILPIYSSIPKVSDRALFLNILRGKNDPENLSSPEELPGGLPWFICKQFLKEHGYELSDAELYLQSGESVDDFFELKHQDANVLGPLIIHNHYQVFDTDSDKYILLFDNHFNQPNQCRLHRFSRSNGLCPDFQKA